MSTRKNNMKFCEMSVMTNNVDNHDHTNPSAPYDYTTESACLLNNNSRNPYVDANGYPYELNNYPVVPTQIIEFHDVDLTRSSNVTNVSIPGSKLIRRIDCDPTYSMSDGKQIVNNNKIATVLSNQVGLKAQTVVKNNIARSAVTDKVDNFRLGAVDPLDLPTAYPIPSTSKDAEVEKKNATMATKPTGYQFSDYKSIYESEGGKLSYYMPEYKSIYD